MVGETIFQHFVSIARRRLVVLRLAALGALISDPYLGFNRPKAISCLATDGCGKGGAGHGKAFQSPEGD